MILNIESNNSPAKDKTFVLRMCLDDSFWEMKLYKGGQNIRNTEQHNI